jgi:hypothetical protein
MIDVSPTLIGNDKESNSTSDLILLLICNTRIKDHPGIKNKIIIESGKVISGL